MSDTVAVLSFFGAVIGAPLLFVFLIPAAVSAIASRPPRRAKTPAGMIALSVQHPVTAGDWAKESVLLRTNYINQRLGISFWRSYGRAGADFPLNWRDGKMLARAANLIDRRVEREKTVAALEQVSEQFERAYGTNA